MNKPPKFLYAKSRSDDRQFIIHTQKPRFLAQVFASTGDLILVQELAEKFPYGARTNRIDNTFYVIPVIEFFDEPENVNDIPKIMSRMGDWFYSLKLDGIV